ncbi:MAG TPA: IclR family transcriptional regulator [Gaiellaceae bacterium]|nr:IclR family transcriptional regulator [Gaiellaceae bacterium]
MARTGKPATRTVSAVARALAVLDAFLESPELGTNEIARRTGLNASTVSRLLATLAQAGFVAHVEETGRYRLGSRLMLFGNLVHSRLDLRDALRPLLEELAERTGETTTLSVPSSPDAVTIDFVQAPGSVVSVAELGRPSVAHATAAGKVGLAFGEAELPAGRLVRFTARTIVDRKRLSAELERVTQDGLARAAGEREPDLNALAAPVFGRDGRLAAIVGVQGPAPRFDEQAMADALGALRAASSGMSHALGFGLDLEPKESE